MHCRFPEYTAPPSGTGHARHGIAGAEPEIVAPRPPCASRRRGASFRETAP